ncbi:MAG: acylphosphatase [Candidatus Omnitrophica bacterium]|nr:acylphosphatase [Candidatus Omnitrophota bacterium]
MTKRVHVYYSGNVQGVGFRFAADRIASEAGLTGWVRNLSDGRVEVVAEGEEDDLTKFLDSINKGMRHYIIDADVQWLRAKGEFNRFSIAL